MVMSLTAGEWRSSGKSGSSPSSSSISSLLPFPLRGGAPRAAEGGLRTTGGGRRAGVVPLNTVQMGLGRGIVDITAIGLRPTILGGGGRSGGLPAAPAAPAGGLAGGVIVVEQLFTVIKGEGLVWV